MWIILGIPEFPIEKEGLLGKVGVTESFLLPVVSAINEGNWSWYWGIHTESRMTKGETRRWLT